MQTQYTGRNIEITPALRDYTDKKLSRLINHREYITHIHVIFNVDKLLQTVEAQISVPKKTLYAKSEADEMYKAIDILVDKLVRQLNEYHDKLVDHHRQ